MTATAYNTGIVAGLALVGYGARLVYGAGVAFMVIGCAVIGLTVLGAAIGLRR